ncbi:UTP--glucose-1-phosphate uridylyltransferase [Thermoflavimicrobium dichotomicum]|uniref:UDP-N-acetylglucosamine/UDP-N-acetylgalactosamine diphosphorylase n=1 Tax=Thermoflavimicrobium dichotomicum TaxID=46223 RepID=A0A1I3V967_9BACL|nr:UDPGP type 1 family protein [Thermoflavimicrobium dichotomicum]SFJ90671.1 UDP-N-acetylglucosamine/UDP-N-acetylgalactosaminediphosphorylase [Thermoflavimicrobium dichotomicum]
MNNQSKYENIKNLLQKYKQEHLLNHYESLSLHEQESLLNEIQRIDFEKIVMLYNQIVNCNNDGEIEFKPLEAQNWGELDKKQKEHFNALGMDLIKNGKVASLVVAGGQGSRLGCDGPKGTYNIGLPSQKSLFQLQAERLINLSNKVNRFIPWYVMTNPENHEETLYFFKKNRFFGYPQHEIFFFKQDVLPALDMNGKILMSSPSQICFVPNGNGGCFSALKRSGGLNDLKQRGVEWLFYYNVDNALIKVADPGFIGYSHVKGHPIASKVIEKRNPDEKVGLFVLKNGRPSVIEYTELPENIKQQKNLSEQLLYNQANISIHLFHINFIEKVVDCNLPYRVAKKSIKTISGQVDAYKFELFIFDLFPYSKSMTIIKVNREEEFAPVKNKTGPDSPSTAKNLVLNLHRKWLLNAGIPEELIDDRVIEISPLVSYCGEGLSVDLVQNQLNPLVIERSQIK